MKGRLRFSWAFFLILTFVSLGAQSETSIPPVEGFRITIDGQDFGKRLQGNNLDFSNRTQVKFFLGTREVSEGEYLRAAGEIKMADEADSHQRNLSSLFWSGMGAGLLGVVLSATGGKSENGNPSTVSGIGFTLVLGSLVPMLWGHYNKTRFDVFQVWKIGQNANRALMQAPTLGAQPTGSI